MTSKDKDMVSLPVSPWDAILKAAKDQLPSLDSDSSPSDCEEEEPFIFQRNQPVLIPDLAEELAEDPFGIESGTWIAVGRSSSPEPLPIPGRLAIEPRSGQKQLEDWDLDYILQSLPGRQDSQGDSAPRTAWWLAERYQNQGHTSGLSQDTILEQLALLCATQSRVCNHTWKVPVDKPQDPEEQEARSRSAWAESRRLKTEPPTIFLDLRQTEPSEPQARQSQESSEHSSSDSEEADVETAGPGQGPSSQERRDCTGKSQLLQQLRAFRKGAVPSHRPTSDSPRGQKAQAPEDTGSHTRRKKHIKLGAGKQKALDLGDPLGTQPSREVLLPATGQLYSTQVKDLKSRLGGRFRSTQPWCSLYSLPLEAETLALDPTQPV
ncbi:uncharacterized protein C16orf71 homolog isoform X2 [Peromyscus leucopus]|uniref:uncharacterized protein C16orf71 homolog isoform X2 n=1 Tax=Peromyscus leucopus TaxID=10041 RepID=UPI0018857919|nr:uncharacterized protein C16orf71 homolog isoform X2 [Peromyscus leucopus]